MRSFAHWSRCAWLAASITVLFLATASAQTHDMNAHARHGSLTIDHAWARAVPAGKTTAVYFSITNTGPADKLTGVATDIAAQAGLHRSSVDDKGVMSMTRVPALDCPAGSTVTLAPGGYHVMLMSLKQPLKSGDHFAMTLTFEKAGTINITVPVSDSALDPHRSHVNPMGNM